MRFEQQTLEFLKKYKKHSKGLNILTKLEQTKLDYYRIRFKSNSTYAYYLSKTQDERLEQKLPFKKMQKIKIGRLINRISKELNITITDKAVENSINVAKVFKKEFTFEITDDYKKAYYYLNYDIPPKATWMTRRNYGNLGNNCMRNSKNQKELQYYKEVGVKVAVLRNGKNNKVVARCLVWNNMEVWEVDNTMTLINAYDKLYYKKDICKAMLKIRLHQEGLKPLPKRKKLVYNFPVKKLFAHYPYGDNLKYLSFDFTSVSNVHDSVHLEFEQYDNRRYGFDFTIECPNCRSKTTPIMLILDKKKQKVRGCTNCFIKIGNTLVNMKDDDISISDKIGVLFTRDENNDLIIDERFDKYKK